jgi:uncharacterized protein YbjQ (UPF0145 family)
MTDNSSDVQVETDAVEARLERMRGSRAWGSLFSAQEFAAISSVGFTPVGHVFGTAVVRLGQVGGASRCSGTRSYTPRADLASAAGGPFGAVLRKQYGMRRLALSRAVDECTALGGDGIVGVTLTIKPFPAGGTEFTVQGTAVRTDTAIRPTAPFTSHVSAQEFARLLRAGWMPATLIFGISLGSRHDDTVTRTQTTRTAGNREVRGYTELVRDTRRDARVQLEKAVAAQGADGLVVDQMTLYITERECPTVEGQRDHVAEATILGTSIVSFGRPLRAPGDTPLTIMHLNPPPPVPATPRPAVEATPEAEAVPEGGLLDRVSSKRAVKRVYRGGYSFGDPAASGKRPGSDD